MKKAFLIIEVLISIFIISLIILNINLIYKNLVVMKEKNDFYQNYYITVKSIINIINTQHLTKLEGNLNGFKYKIRMIPLKKKRNFIIDPINNIKGNYGKNLYTLYKVVLLIKRKNFSKKIIFFKTEILK